MVSVESVVVIWGEGVSELTIGCSCCSAIVSACFVEAEIACVVVASKRQVMS